LSFWEKSGVGSSSGMFWYGVECKFHVCSGGQPLLLSSDVTTTVT